MNLHLPSCNVEAWTAINPSEDPDKVLDAVSNVLPESTSTVAKSYVKVVSDNAAPLRILYDMIVSRQSQGSLGRNVRHNAGNSETWFYLNKQAAYAGVAAVCENSEESPLGPIRITVRSSCMQDIMEWLG